MKTMVVYLQRIVMCCLMFVAINAVFAQDYQAKHEVQRGETLASIAKQYGVTEQMIKDANPQAGNLFYVGLKLNIPSKGKVDNKIVEEKQETHKASGYVVSNNDNVIQHYTSNSVINYYAEGVDNYFVYQPDFKTYALDVSMDMYKYFFWGMSFYSNLKFKPEKALSFQINLNLGIKKRVLINDNFMLVGKLYPYIGWCSAPYSDDTDFTYGAQAMIGAGVKLFDTSKGKSVFLSGGYSLVAGEFKTKGMFDYGYWMLGITFVTK